MDINAERLKERFIRYAKIYSQSKDGEDRYPSTPQQDEFAKILEQDLKDMGLQDVKRDKYQYVTATLPATKGCEDKPVIGLLAHFDTYFGTDGENVKPIVHVYEGGDIVLPDDPEVKILEEENPYLAQFKGQEIITASGKTLLGADDKAGLAEILEAVQWMMEHPEHPHPTLRLGFTPDEEIGKGTEHFDVKAFGAQVAYTMDGSEMGEVEDETFCADMATVKIQGRDVHPGYAKGKMINAARLAARFIESVPLGMSPETAEGREGFVHPVHLQSDTHEATVIYIVRSFDVEGLKRQEDYLTLLAESLQREFPGSKVEVTIKEQYRNMKYDLGKEPRAVPFAVEAVKAAGIEVKQTAIRGGTDGARLTAMGLPTPNIFAGGINFHSKFEWVAVPVMVKATETILHLTKIWAEKG
jgi:tripeptide aminopeptidase